MNDVMKIIIPLLDESLELSDVSEEAGFVDGYLEDINRPSLTNHIFLLYDGNLDTKKKLERDCKLRKLDTLYTRTTIFISGNPYLLYAFVILNESIQDVRNGILPYKSEDLYRILMFWNLTDSFINGMFTGRVVQVTTEGVRVPEEDYIPSWEEEFETSAS